MAGMLQVQTVLTQRGSGWSTWVSVWVFCLLAYVPPHCFSTHIHPWPELFHHPRRAANTLRYFGYGPIHIPHARMQRMKPWHGYLRLFHMHAKYRSAVTVCGEDTQERAERRRRVRYLCNKLPRLIHNPRDYFTENTMATEPAASPTVPVMAHLKLVARCPWEEVAQGHAIWLVFYVAGCSTLQEGWAVKGRILSIILINVSVIRDVFLITGLETLRHTAPLPGRPNKQKGVLLYM